jgi:glycosyltransferase involved in cell wall biosynthesis
MRSCVVTPMLELFERNTAVRRCFWRCRCKVGFVRVLAFIEALGVTGPARNLFALAPHVDLHLAAFRRLSLGSAHCEGLSAFAAAAAARGVPVRVIDERSRLDWRVFDSIVELVASLRPDIIESHHLKSHALLAVTRRRTEVPWAAWHHGYTRKDLKDVAYSHIDRWSLPRADIVVTTCEPFAHALESSGVASERLHVIHNAVARPRTLARSWARAQLGLRDERIVLAVGRLSHEKGHDVLIDGCAAVRGPLRDELLLLIAGDGPERSRLERQARRRGVRIRFDGYRSDLSSHYAAADVFALASRSEGSPNALLEAMAAGRPIVAACVGGVPEIVDARSAMLVPPDDSVALAAAITRLLAFPDLANRLGAGAREAAARFSADQRAARVLSVYSSLSAARAGGLAR